MINPTMFRVSPVMTTSITLQITSRRFGGLIIILIFVCVVKRFEIKVYEG